MTRDHDDARVAELLARLGVDLICDLIGPLDRSPTSLGDHQRVLVAQSSSSVA